MTRAVDYESRPEDAGDADAYYDHRESKRYHLHPEVLQKQFELTSRAIDLLDLGSAAQLIDGHCLFADIGCGSGLSGSVLAQLGCPWIGIDVSQHMLQLAADAAATNTGPNSTPANPTVYGPNLARADMGQGLPLRPNCLDAAISISALQWLLEQPSSAAANLSQVTTNFAVPAATADIHSVSAVATNATQSEHGGCGSSHRAVKFFKSLHSCLKPGAAAIAQFYPRDAAEAQVLLSAAASAGLTAHLLVDCPHRTAARKYYLHAVKPLTSPTAAAAVTQSVTAAAKYDQQEAASRATASGSCSYPAAAAVTAASRPPECPLGHPIGGVCSIWWRQHHQQHPEQSCKPDHLHSNLQGGYSSSRAELRAKLPVDCNTIDDWVYNHHIKHCKKLVRLMYRAAIHSGYSSLPTHQQGMQQDQCINNGHTAAAHVQAAATAVDSSADRSPLLKVLLQLDLSGLLQQYCWSRRRGLSSRCSCGFDRCCHSSLEQQPMLNCFGNELVLGIVGKPQDLVSVGLTAQQQQQQQHGEADAGAADVGQLHNTAGKAQGATASAQQALELGQQISDALQQGLWQQQQKAGGLQAGEPDTGWQKQQQQQQQGGMVKLLSAEWIAATDLQAAGSQQQEQQQQQQQQPTGKRQRRARQQYMQATFAPLDGAQQPNAGNSAHSCRDSGSTTAGAAIVSWQRLETAEAFTPHTIGCMASTAAQGGMVSAAAAAADSLQSNCSRGDEPRGSAIGCTNGGANSAADAISLLARGLLGVRASSNSSEASSGALQANQQCLGVYGGLLMRSAGVGSWHLMLGCY